MQIRWGNTDGPFGKFVLAQTPHGISHLGFYKHDPSEILETIKTDWPRATLIRDDSAAAEGSAHIFSHPQTSIQLHLIGTKFQINVWRALLQIPAGTLTTYGRLAAQLGTPSAARAIGNAVSKNRIALLIPCHRVVRENGKLGGFRWGIEKKRILIESEKISSFETRESLGFLPSPNTALSS